MNAVRKASVRLSEMGVAVNNHCLLLQREMSARLDELTEMGLESYAEMISDEHFEMLCNYPSMDDVIRATVEAINRAQARISLKSTYQLEAEEAERQHEYRRVLVEWPGDGRVH